jgi:hypothetical protein
MQLHGCGAAAYEFFGSFQQAEVLPIYFKFQWINAKIIFFTMGWGLSSFHLLSVRQMCWKTIDAAAALQQALNCFVVVSLFSFFFWLLFVASFGVRLV